MGSTSAECGICCCEGAQPCNPPRNTWDTPGKVVRRALLGHNLYTSVPTLDRKTPTLFNSRSDVTSTTITELFNVINESGDKDRANSGNDELLQWLCKICPANGDVLEERISAIYASEPLCLDISDQDTPTLNVKENEQNYPVIKNLCKVCKKLVRLYLKYEQMNRTMGRKLVKAILKCFQKPPIVDDINESKTDIQNCILLPSDATSINLIHSSEHSGEPFIPSSTIVNSEISKNLKRKRGRPPKIKPNALEKGKPCATDIATTKLDSSKSKCPFCFKVYSIQNSFVHHCLTYRNTLRCTDCNIFSSTYIRFEKHLENFHQKKRLLRCPVLNCNQKFISKPAFTWHLHFHQVEQVVSPIDISSPNSIQLSGLNSTAEITINPKCLKKSCKISVNSTDGTDLSYIPPAPNQNENSNASPKNITIKLPPNTSFKNIPIHLTPASNSLSAAIPVQDRVFNVPSNVTSRNRTTGTSLVPLPSVESLIATCSASPSHAVLPVLDQQEILNNLIDLNAQTSLDLQETIRNDTMPNINYHQHHLPTTEQNLNSLFEDSDQNLVTASLPNPSFSMPIANLLSEQNNVQINPEKSIDNSKTMKSVHELFDVSNNPIIANERSLSLDQHILLNHRVSEHEYQCPVCNQAFFVIKELVNHLNNHKSNELCKCSICFSKMNTKQEIVNKMPQNDICNEMSWQFSSHSTSFPTTPMDESSIAHATNCKQTLHLSSRDRDRYDSIINNEECLPSSEKCSSRVSSNIRYRPVLETRISRTAPVDVDFFAQSSPNVVSDEDVTQKLPPNTITVRSNPILSYDCRNAYNQSMPILDKVLSTKQVTVDVPFVENVEDNFIPTTENLSVVKALEGSGGNTLAPIERLLGAVDEMDYFS